MTERKVDCEACQHYRPQVSFADAYKLFDRSGPRLPIMKSLQDIRKEETKVLETEAELQFDLVRAEELVWPTRPRFAPLCVASDGQFIPAVKNRNNDCPDFEPALARQGKACGTCKFVTRPIANIGDKRQNLTASMNDSERSFYRQKNKEQDDADATAQALEIEQAFYGDGKNSVVTFLPICAVQTSGPERFVVPFCNMRQDCAEYSPLFAVPKSAVEAVKRGITVDDRTGIEHTVALAKLVADAGIEKPGAFIKAFSQWVKGDPSRSNTQTWVGICITTRWPQEAPKGWDQGALSEAIKASPLVGKGVTGGGLIPVIAGCDAYEWGLLAALSRTGEGGAIAAANAICQQAAEFLVTVFSPIDAARCIDGLLALVMEPGLFSTATSERINGFFRRLRTKAADMRHVAGMDLMGYFESFAGKVSYEVGGWLRLFPKDSEKLAIVDPGLAETMLLRANDKVEIARKTATLILDVCSTLAEGRVSQKERKDFLDRILENNENAVKRDIQDQNEVQEATINWAKRMVGSTNDALGNWIHNQMAGQQLNQQYQSVQALELSPRRLAASLLAWRGGLAITPTALELLNREPRMDRTPETIEDALREPVSKTVEAFHAGRLQAPSEVMGIYLAGFRRAPAPYQMPVPPVIPKSNVSSVAPAVPEKA